MSQRLAMFSRNPAQIEAACRQIGEKAQVIASDRLDVLAEQIGREAVRALLVDVTPECLGAQSPGTALDALRDAAGEVQIVGLIDPDCPDRLSQWARINFDRCYSWPATDGELDDLLRDTPDVRNMMADFCRDMPHKALHGETHSLLTFTPEMFEMLDELSVAARHDVTVLLIGETGAGKTHLARLIHELSDHRAERILTLACGTLPPDLIESELFGYVKGAFTGADQNKEGKFAAAGRGTLLLDEIDVLPPEQQAKLLRVIETGEYEPVGSNETRKSEARLIVASNYDLEGLVENGTFRQDLFYRLNVLNFRLPPLRERPWDIQYLARQFALEHSRAHKIELRDIDPEFLEALKRYAWPGNIRELDNVIRRAVLYCQRGVLRLKDLPSSMRPTSMLAPVADITSLTLDSRIQRLEQHIIVETLERNANRRQETARELGISRVTLYNKMKKYDMLHITADTDSRSA
ncbi:MAG: sigma-54 dependent transcriptional regulator [Pirellulales bacterium]|nr:sigma-54 dependent transcriptional regulator [Pirellulales bacterium]